MEVFLKYICFIYDVFGKSLDNKFFFNVFDMLKTHDLFYNLNDLNIQIIINLITINMYFSINIILLFYIIFCLFKNMFDFSLKFYVINDFFNSQKYSILYKDWNWAKNIIFWNLILSSGCGKKNILVYQAADTLLTICVVLYVTIFFNFILYFNNLNLLLAQNKINLILNINLFKWISYGFDSINFGFIIDNLSLLMLVVVLTISALVHYYSIDYMATDPRLLTFLKYLSGFTLAMVILVTANNLALLFLGWEGVGIFSYLLIGFWYTRTLALKASLKAVIVNRVGDIALIIAIALTLHYFGTIEFKKLETLILYMFTYKSTVISIKFLYFDISIITLICFFLLIAAIGKSAQFGLHTWLPDAMEGPTPVSALIHAATMVTAGVYLVVRTSFLFELSDVIRNAVLIIGSFTALFGSITACYQYDIKRIIAFSTCSQLGYMFLACGLSAYNLAMFHLFIHAFFKALLFLCAGSVIHSIGDEQDIRKMGGLFNYLPITYTGLCIGFFSLAGLPFTSGFFSKDTIIELAMTKRTIPGAYAYICATIGAWCTAFYSFRFFYQVIFKSTKISRTILMKVSEHGTFMLNVIFILTIITIFIGGFTKNPLTSPFSFILFNDSIFIRDYNFYFNIYENFLKFYVLIHEYNFHYFKIVLFITPFFGISLSLLIYWYFDLYNSFDRIYEYSVCHDSSSLEPYTNTWESDLDEIDDHQKFQSFFTPFFFQKFFENKGYTDLIYNSFIVKPILNFSYEISFKQLDRGWLEYFFVKTPTYISFFISKNLNQSFGTLKMNFLPALFFVLTILLYIFYLIFN